MIEYYGIIASIDHPEFESCSTVIKSVDDLPLLQVEKDKTLKSNTKFTLTPLSAQSALQKETSLPSTSKAAQQTTTASPTSKAAQLSASERKVDIAKTKNNIAELKAQLAALRSRTSPPSTTTKVGGGTDLRFFAAYTATDNAKDRIDLSTSVDIVSNVASELFMQNAYVMHDTIVNTCSIADKSYLLAEIKSSFGNRLMQLLTPRIGVGFDFNFYPLVDMLFAMHHKGVVHTRINPKSILILNNSELFKDHLLLTDFSRVAETSSLQNQYKSIIENIPKSMDSYSILYGMYQDQKQDHILPQFSTAILQGWRYIEPNTSFIEFFKSQKETVYLMMFGNPNTDSEELNGYYEPAFIINDLYGLLTSLLFYIGSHVGWYDVNCRPKLEIIIYAKQILTKLVANQQHFKESCIKYCAAHSMYTLYNESECASRLFENKHGYEMTNIASTLNKLYDKTQLLTLEMVFKYNMRFPTDLDTFKKPNFFHNNVFGYIHPADIKSDGTFTLTTRDTIIDKIAKLPDILKRAYKNVPLLQHLLSIWCIEEECFKWYKKQFAVDFKSYLDASHNVYKFEYPKLIAEYIKDQVINQQQTPIQNVLELDDSIKVESIEYHIEKKQIGFIEIEHILNIANTLTNRGNVKVLQYNKRLYLVLDRSNEESESSMFDHIVNKFLRILESSPVINKEILQKFKVIVDGNYKEQKVDTTISTIINAFNKGTKPEPVLAYAYNKFASNIEDVHKFNSNTNDILAKKLVFVSFTETRHPLHEPKWQLGLCQLLGYRTDYMDPKKPKQDSHLFYYLTYTPEKQLITDYTLSTVNGYAHFTKAIADKFEFKEASVFVNHYHKLNFEIDVLKKMAFIPQYECKALFGCYYIKDEVFFPEPLTTFDTGLYYAIDVCPLLYSVLHDKPFSFAVEDAYVEYYNHSIRLMVQNTTKTTTKQVVKEEVTATDSIKCFLVLLDHIVNKYKTIHPTSIEYLACRIKQCLIDNKPLKYVELTNHICGDAIFNLKPSTYLEIVSDHDQSHITPTFASLVVLKKRNIDKKDMQYILSEEQSQSIEIQLPQDMKDKQVMNVSSLTSTIHTNPKVTRFIYNIILNSNIAFADKTACIEQYYDYQNYKGTNIKSCIYINIESIDLGTYIDDGNRYDILDWLGTLYITGGVLHQIYEKSLGTEVAFCNTDLNDISRRAKLLELLFLQMDRFNYVTRTIFENNTTRIPTVIQNKIKIISYMSEPHEPMKTTKTISNLSPKASFIDDFEYRYSLPGYQVKIQTCAPRKWKLTELVKSDPSILYAIDPRSLYYTTFYGVKQSYELEDVVVVYSNNRLYLLATKTELSTHDKAVESFANVICFINENYKQGPGLVFEYLYLMFHPDRPLPNIDRLDRIVLDYFMTPDIYLFSA